MNARTPQVLQDEPPLPPAGTASEALRDFIRCCMATDPRQRPSAECLLQHPFITAHAPAPGAPAHDGGAADVKRFMAVMLDPMQKCAPRRRAGRGEGEGGGRHEVAAGSTCARGLWESSPCS